MHFAKLFSSILDSTIWQEAHETRLVWITMLAMSDRHGAVYASLPGLASRAKVTVAECEEAIKCLSSPDKYSRTKDHDGKRIKEIDGGWALLNHGKYRELLSSEERREYLRVKQREHRAKMRQQPVNNTSTSVNKSQHCQHIVDVDVDVDEVPAIQKSLNSKVKREGKGAHARPTVDEIKAYCLDVHLPESDGEWFFDKCEASGWKNGGHPIISWQATIRSWKKCGYMCSQKTSTATNGNHADNFV